MRLRGLLLQLQNHFKANTGWHAKNRITEMRWMYRDGIRVYGAGYVDRALRHLETLRVLAVKYESDHAFYQYLAPEQRKSYVPTSHRPQEKKDRLWVKGEEPKRIIGYETVLIDGIRHARPKYGV